MISKFHFCIYLVSLLLVGCQLNDSNNSTLIFETEFIYTFEQKDDLNFSFHASQNGLDSALIQVASFKQDPTVDFPLSPNFYLAKNLYHNIKTGTLPIYIGAQKIEPESKEINELLSVIRRAKPNIYETTVALHNAWMDWSSYKIKQQWTYNSTTQMLQNSVISFAPTYAKNTKDIPTEHFQINSNQKNNSPIPVQTLLNQKENTWIKETQNYISFDNIHFTKGDLEELKRVIWGDIFQKKKEVWTYNYHEELEPMDVSIYLTEMKDTTVSFDLETYEEFINIFTYEPRTFENLHGFNLIQTWYFDASTLSLNCQLEGIEPLDFIPYKRKPFFKKLFLIKPSKSD